MSTDNLFNDGAAFQELTAQQHLIILRLFTQMLNVAERNNVLNRILRLAESRYVMYLDLLLSLPKARGQDLPRPPWDVALLLHAHMLSPLRFRNDMKKGPYASLYDAGVQFPFARIAQDIILLSLKDKSKPDSSKEWRRMYRTEPYDLFLVNIGIEGNMFEVVISRENLWNLSNDNRWSYPSSNPLFSMDLPQAVLRQRGFADKITTRYPHDPVSPALLWQARTRYAKFMGLMRGRMTPLVPTLDIDLIWHTHQLSPVEYSRWCMHHIGRDINHDDTIEENSLDTGLQSTQALWSEIYNEAYLDNAPSRPPVGPPPSLTPAQRALWDFDAHMQMIHQDVESKAVAAFAEMNQLQNEEAKCQNESNDLVIGFYGKSYFDRHYGNKPQRGIISSILSFSKEKEIRKEEEANLPPKTKINMHNLRQQMQAIGNRKLNISKDIIQTRAKLMAEWRNHNMVRNRWRQQRWPLLVAANAGQPPMQPKFPRSIRKDPKYQGSMSDPRTDPEHDYDPRVDPRNLYWPPPFPVYPATWYTPYYGVFSYISGGNGSYGAVTCGSNQGAGCGTAAGGCSNFTWSGPPKSCSSCGGGG
jgi:hypothetical protein